MNLFVNKNQNNGVLFSKLLITPTEKDTLNKTLYMYTLYTKHQLLTQIIYNIFLQTYFSWTSKQMTKEIEIIIYYS